MANLFTNVPAPAGDGSGAAVDFSAYGSSKTIVVTGSWPETLQPTINIEINNAAVAADGSWAPIATFQGAGTEVVDVAARWIRATVSNYRGGPAPEINIGGTDAGTSFANLPVTAGNGSGAGVDVSALGLFKTVHVGAQFRGATIIEVSNDGGASWSQEMAFNNPGQRSAIFAADFMRVTRSGVPIVAPGLPVVNVGACDLGGGGGGGGGGNAQRFQYTVTGVEPDLSELVIPLPAARSDALYLVTPSQEQATYGLHANVATASKTTTQFTLSLSADATAGDVFSFIVDDPT